ncbi:MAG: DUF1574 domain-containing protein [Candidatus Obscuribacterales bacterium]|nr:DUF1574 domain-containing protein [Candidatus Obscuribacterales bacterium]
MNSQRKQAKSRLLRELAGSVTLWSLVLFLLADFSLRQIYQQSLIDEPREYTSWKTHSAVKLPKQLRTSDSADILILGSSQMLAPAVRCDDEYHKRTGRFDDWYKKNIIHQNVHADFLEHLIKRDFKQDKDILNLAVSAGMISDSALILKKYLDAGHRPNTVVLGINPRDFLDKSRAAPSATPTFRLIADASNCLECDSPKEALDFLFQCAVHSYRNREGYQQHFNRILLTAQGRNPSLESGFVTPPSDSEEQIRLYRKMYLPIDWQSFQTQKRYLDQILQITKQKHIKTILVDMPASKPYRDIFPRSTIEKYDATLKALATRYDAQLLQPDKPGQYHQDDFEDLLHLNAHGGRKLFASIANAIESEAI